MPALTSDMSGMQRLGMLAKQRRRRGIQALAQRQRGQAPVQGQMQQAQGRQAQTLAQARMQGGRQSAVRSASATPTSQGLSSDRPPSEGIAQQRNQLMSQRAGQLLSQRRQAQAMGQQEQNTALSQQAMMQQSQTLQSRKKRKAAGLSSTALT